METKPERSFGHAFGIDLLRRFRCEVSFQAKFTNLRRKSQLPELEQEVKPAIRPIKPLVAHRVTKDNYQFDMSGQNLVVTCKRRLRVEIDQSRRIVQVDGYCSWVETDYGERHCGYAPEVSTIFPNNEPALPVELDSIIREDEFGILHLRLGSGSDEIRVTISNEKGIVMVEKAAIKARFGGNYVLDGPGHPNSAAFSNLAQQRPAVVASMLDRIKLRSNLF